tara:strand:+ start:358 stop:510 length:153 start_codon:yes stop_codon:yes gene_type:complete
VPGTIDRDECVNFRAAFTEKVLHPAKISDAFLTDSADKKEIGSRLQISLI